MNPYKCPQKGGSRSQQLSELEVMTSQWRSELTWFTYENYNTAFSFEKYNFIHLRGVQKLGIQTLTSYCTIIVVV